MAAWPKCNSVWEDLAGQAGILDDGKAVARTSGENELFLKRGSSPPKYQDDSQ
jgi:hypothetical protein